MTNTMLKLVPFILLAACESVDAPRAKRYARDFITEIPNAVSVRCVDTDTDRDGYITCTVFMKDGAEPIQIQCGAEKWCVANCAQGCKYVPAVKMNARP